ncbi:unnamed protein product [Blepharisma stoltei]|uniref:Uncharacterized protein n=1 Tax=Blepharisma stoltei TaxID=1481888 RepID=A0AAU9JUZ3_9CILI|nr:unnamed protein product [Blepharisma stoltei]
MPWLPSRKKSLIFLLGFLMIISFFWALVIYTEESSLEDQKNDDAKVIIGNSNSRVKPSNVNSKSHPSAKNQDTDSFNTNAIKPLISSPEVNIFDEGIKCFPHLSGYQKFQSDYRYKYHNRQLACNYDPLKVFDIKNNTLIMNCSNAGPAQYSLGNNPNFEILGNVKYNPDWRPYFTDPIDLDKHEYGFVKCGNTKKQGWLHNKYSWEVSDRVKERTENITKELNLTETQKPLTVLVLMVDAVSRQHFFRSMGSTVEFIRENIINGTYSDTYNVYDFYNGNSHGENTLPNLVPLLFGHSYFDHLLQTRYLSLKSADSTNKFLKIQEKIIWKDFEKNGFVTMFGWETRWDYFAEIGGRKILCDHVAASFWRGALEVSGFTDFSEKQRCIGNHHSHEFLFNYTKEFLENYEGHNKFGYAHFSSGHEITGSVLEAMDADLAEFLEKTMRIHNEKNEDLAILLLSDHGLHMGPWDRYEEGLIENLSPFTIFIANKQLLSKINENSHEILLHNTQRLVGKYDVYLTLKHLSTVPYGNAMLNYKDWKNEINLTSVVSLFHEEIPDNRTCEDIGIPLYWCNCLKYEKININDESSLAHHIAIEAVGAINRKNIKDKSQEVCMEIKLEKVIKIEEELKESQKYSGNMYKVSFSIRERSGVVFTAFAYVAKTFKYSKEEKENEIYPISQFESFRVQIQKIVRADNKDDFCCEVAEVIGAKCSFCICTHPKDYQIAKVMPAKKKSTLEKLKKSLFIAVGNVDKSCNETCAYFNKKCEKWGLSLVNRLEILKEPWRVQSSSNIYKDKGFMDFKNSKVDKTKEGKFPGLLFEDNKYTFIQADWDKLSCDAKNDKYMPICPCTYYHYN